MGHYVSTAASTHRRPLFPRLDGGGRGQQNGNLLGSTTPQKMGYIFKL